MFSLRLAALLCVATPFAWSFVPSTQKEQKSFDIELIDAGAEPRQALRFMPQAGDEGELSMSMSQVQEMTVNGREMPAPVAPEMRMTMATKVEAIDEAGLVTQSLKGMRFELGGDPDEGMRKQLEKVLKPLQEFEGSITFDSRGFVHETDFEVPEGADPLLKTILTGFERSMSEMVLPFPEEEVGVGAKWTIGTDLKMNGMTMRSVSKVALVALSAKGATLKIENEVTAEAQAIDGPDLPPGAEFNLEGATGSGKSESVIEFRHYHPISTSLESEVDMEMVTKMGERERHMKMKVSMSLEATRHALETAK